MKPENAIEVHNITKKFRVYYDKGKTLKEMALFSKRRKYENRVVLDNISFEVKKGEAVGLIGHNGCGKSTTLKLLTRIMYPDSGTIEMRGRVSSLIELGAGFHPDLSGRENIYINASIFGLTKKEIDAKLDDIIAFSELEEFIDNPVRTYSSGMYMRLAFAVAINVNADILLIDEILAVGDAGFQEKCFNKLKEIKATGTTIVIVSHSLGQIEQICERSIWINHGKIKMEGNPIDVDYAYLDYMNEERREIAEKEAERQKEKENSKAAETETKKKNQSRQSETFAEEESNSDVNVQETITAGRKLLSAGTTVKNRYGSKEAEIKNIKFVNKDGKESTFFSTDEECQIIIDYSVHKRVEDADFGVGIFRNDGLQCYGTNTRIERFPTFHLEKDGTVVINIQELSLLPGQYWLDVAIERGNGIPVDYYRKAMNFTISSTIGDVGVSRLKHIWTVN